jgi:ribosomal-protein-serine acetyltransferase
LVSILVDEHLLMRSYTVEDADPLFDTVERSRKHLQPWCDWVPKTTRAEHSLMFIQQSIHDQQVQTSLVLGIFYDQKVIGEVAMHHWDHDTKRAQIGYWISKDYEGRNIMFRCLYRFCDFLFEKVGLNKIEIHFIPANKRSARIAERLGCRIEGILRANMLRNGMYEDVVIAGILKDEWGRN